MKILKRDEYAKLLNDNPGQKFIFFEYKPCYFASVIHVTMGDEHMPTFGAWAPSPVDTEYMPNNAWEDFYDWNLNEYSASDQFAVLEESELNFLESLISEANYITINS